MSKVSDENLDFSPGFWLTIVLISPFILLVELYGALSLLEPKR